MRIINEANIPLTNKDFKIVEMIEYAPQKRTISVGEKYYFLQFPYMLFWRTNYQCRCVFLTESFNKKSYLYSVFLGNVFSNLSICMDKFPVNEEISLKEVVDYFWTSSFSDDDWRGVLNCCFAFKKTTPQWGDNYNKLIHSCYEDWAKISLDELNDKLKNGDNDKMPFKHRHTQEEAFNYE